MVSLDAQYVHFVDSSLSCVLTICARSARMLYFTKKNLPND